MRFAGGLLLGLILGGAAGAGGMYLYSTRAPAIAPSPPESAPATPPAKGKRPRRAAAAPAAASDELTTIITAADLRIVSEGDTLRAAPVTMDLGPGGAEPRDLEQQEIDGTFARGKDGIIACITAARGRAEVNGRVVAGVVVGADGRVSRSRIEGPAYFLERGLGRCARRELEALRFPATGKETVVNVPFDVRD